MYKAIKTGRKAIFSLLGEGRIGNEVEKSHFSVGYLLNVKEAAAEEKKKKKEKLGNRQKKILS